MDYKEWLGSVPAVITGDKLWSVKSYRLGLYAADLGWQDVTKLMGDRRTIALSDQLCRSLGSISANISEGYSRSSFKDRTRFYEYALGSARESRGWYYKGRHVLGEATVENRMSVLTEIIRLLLTTVPNERSNAVREEASVYDIEDPAFAE